MKHPRFFQSLVPHRFESPIALAMRLFRTGDKSAYFAMVAAASAFALKPLDLLLFRSEKKLYNAAASRCHPLVFVVGAPRSGTTICQQILLGHLPFAYLNNATSLFPLSPLMGSRVLGGPQLCPQSTSNFYGKTTGLRAPNDALYIWDRWFGADRSKIPEMLDARTATDMQKFFAACEQEYGRPLLNKVNNLIASAHLVEEWLSPCLFICMQRDDAYLAQSLYVARQAITGSLQRPYGLLDRRFRDTDPVRSVCKQALFYRGLAEDQQRKIGNTRFWITEYEEFCRDPGKLITRVAAEVFPGEMKHEQREIAPIQDRNSVKLDPTLFERIESTLQELRQESHVARDVG